MFKRHVIFNLIIKYWKAHNESSTPRRGQLLKYLKQNGIKIARKTLTEHIEALEKDGYMHLDGVVIVLDRKVPIEEAQPNPA